MTAAGEINKVQTDFVPSVKMLWMPNDFEYE